MKDKINIKMFKPFGSMISEQQLPDDLVKDFLDDLKMIRNLPDEKRKDYLFGHKLAGSVESEYLITPEVLMKYKRNYFDVCISEYCQSVYPDTKVDKVVINSAWSVVQKPLQFNSLHEHNNHLQIEQPHPSISCVGYLQVPKFEPLPFAKPHRDVSGCIEFHEGSPNFYSFSSWIKKPIKSTYMLFPSHLQHMVYPFYSKDKEAERISFSFNAQVKFIKKDGKEN